MSFYSCPECHEPRMGSPFAARCRLCTEKLRESQGLPVMQALPETVDWVGPPRSSVSSFVKHVKETRKKRFVVNWVVE